MKNFFWATIFISSSAIPYISMAQGFTTVLGSATGRPFDLNNLISLISGLSCWFLRFGIIAIGVMMIVYGISFLLSRGNATSLSDAKKALWAGIMGGVVILGVFTIILSVTSIMSAVGFQNVPTYTIANIITCQ